AQHESAGLVDGGGVGAGAVIWCLARPHGAGSEAGHAVLKVLSCVAHGSMTPRPTPALVMPTAQADNGTASAACSTSATRSASSSTPTLRRTRPSLMPSGARCAGVKPTCVVVEDTHANDMTSPNDTAWSKTARFSMKALAPARPAEKSSATIPPKAAIWRLATSCPGWSGRPG